MPKGNNPPDPNTPPANPPAPNNPGQDDGNQPGSDDGLRRALAAERKRSRELKKKLRETARAPAPRSPQGRKGKGGKGRQAPQAGDSQDLQVFAQRQLENRLRAVPKDQRGRVQAAIKGLNPARAYDLVDSLIGSGGGDGRQVPPIHRGSPKGKPGPSIEEIRKNPELIKKLPAEKRAELLGHMGVRSGSRIWG